MNWPFISRAAHEAIVAGKDEMIAEYRRQLGLTVSVPSAWVPESPPLAEGSRAPFVYSRPAPEAPKPDELKALIAEVCGTDYQKRAMMLRQLAADRAAKIDEDRIRGNILAGVQVEGVP